MLYQDTLIKDVVQANSLKCTSPTQRCGSMATLIPAGLAGAATFSIGSGFPDLDISTLGIGNHRYFFYHSSLSLVALKWFYDQYLHATEGSTGLAHTLTKTVGGVALAGAAMGVGIHLLTDVFEPKSIVFPVFGSLVDGTLIDDRAWLLTNGLYCFQIAKDCLVLAVGETIDQAVNWVKREFITPLFGPSKPIVLPEETLTRFKQEIIDAVVEGYRKLERMETSKSAPASITAQQIKDAVRYSTRPAATSIDPLDQLRQQITEAVAEYATNISVDIKEMLLNTKIKTT